MINGGIASFRSLLLLRYIVKKIKIGPKSAYKFDHRSVHVKMLTYVDYEVYFFLLIFF